MEKKEVNTDITNKVLNKAKIGLWSIEIEEKKQPRLYLQDFILNLISIKKPGNVKIKRTPEELYKICYDFIDKQYSEEVLKFIKKLIKGDSAEISVALNITGKNLIYIKIVGLRNFGYTDLIHIDGCFQDITELNTVKNQFDEIQKDAKNLSVIASLSDDMDFICYLDSSNWEMLKFKASDSFEQNYIKNTNSKIKNINIWDYLKANIYNCKITEFEDLIDRKKIISKLKKEKEYKIDLQFFFNNAPEYYSLKFVRDTDNKKVIILGLCNINNIIESEITKVNQKKVIDTLQQETQQFMKVMDLNDDFECIYDVDIDNGQFSVFTKTGDFYDELVNNAGKNKDFFKSSKKYIQDFVYNDEQQLITKIINKDYLLKTLSETKQIKVDYRRNVAGEYLWYRMKIIKIDDWNKNHRIRIGLFNNDEDYKKEENLRIHLQDEDFYRRAILNGAYCYFKTNLSKNKIISQIMETENGKPVDYTSKLINPLPDYDEVIMYCSINFVSDDYKESYVNNLNSSYLIKQFELGNTMPEYVCYIHSSILGWHWRRYVNYLSKDSVTNDILSMTVAYDISDKIKQQEEEVRKAEFIKAMSKDYQAVYKVDLKNNTIDTYYINSEKLYDINKLLSSNPSFSEIVQQYIDFTVYPEDKDMLVNRFISAMAEKEIKSSFSLFYRRKYNDKYLYTEMQCIKLGNEKKPSSKFILSFAEKDEAFKHEIEIKQKLEQDLRIIEALASEYSNVFYIDLQTKKLVPYALSEKANEFIKKNDIKKMDINEIFVNYVNQMIYEPDQEKIMIEGNIAKIVEILRNKKSTELIFRVKTKEGPEYRQMRFVKIDDINEKPTAITAAIADRDEEIINKYINERILDEYSSIYYLDIDSEYVKTIKQAKTLSVGRFRSGNFKTVMTNFSEEVAEEYRDTILKLSDISEVKEFLKNEDSREITYQINGLEHSWRRCEWQVIERKQGLPSSILIYFRSIDNLTAEKIELNKKIAIQNLQLENKQKELENALKMAQTANVAKTTFLNNMSHDIRTPMNAINGFTELAFNHIDNPIHVKNYLNKIRQSSNHLLDLINEVLDMSKIESGKMVLNVEEENMAKILHSLRDIVQNDLNNKHLELLIDTFDVQNEDIYCDKLRLNQVLLNLLSNAIKYTNPGGMIAMRITQKQSPKKGIANYEFRVKDTGIGMSEEYIKTIFEPFSREKTATVSGIQGTGLGMSITKSIIEKLGGTIEVNSKEGVGTEFIVNLEFKVNENKQNYQKIEKLNDCRSLVVDSSLNTCTSVAKMLRKFGLRSEWCTSGKEALVRAEEAFQLKDIFRVYVIDFKVPDINGLDIVYKIRQIEGEKASIIVLSDYDWTDIEEEAIKAGVDAFICKPMFPSDLSNVLLNCTGHIEKTEEKKNYSKFIGKKILIVEDNEFNREIAEEILTNAGFVVESVFDGTDAVEKMKTVDKNYYDLILMDIQMPKMDGYEATKKIRNLKNKNSQIPIIAMTANAFEEDKQKALSIGMNGHIAKPIDINKLFETLNEIIE